MVQAWAANPPDPTPAALGSFRQLGCPLTRTRGGKRHPNVQMSALDARFASGRRVPSGLATEPPLPSAFRSVSLEKCVLMSLGRTSLASG